MRLSSATDELGRVLTLAPRLRLARIGDAVVLLGERERYRIGGATALVLEQLDGEATVASVLERIELPAELVLGILASLEQRKLICERREGEPARLAFEDGLGLGESTPSVALVGANEELTRVVADALRNAGLELIDEPATADLRVIVSDDYLDQPTREQAEHARQHDQPCLLLRPTGVQPWIGPYLRPGEGRPCFDCLTHALAEQRPVERWLAEQPPIAMLPASVSAAANLAAITLRRIQPDDPTRLWSLDLPSFTLVEHRVRQRPQCPSCGRASLQAEIGERPIVLHPIPIRSADDGGLRSESPAASLARLQPLVSAVLGPVTHLQPMPGRDRDGHPVYSSSYLVTPRELATGFDRACAGKGCSVEQAKMSALAEAIERSSGTHRGDEAIRWASADELGDEAVDLDALQLFSADQRARNQAPPALPPTQRIAWTPAWSLSESCRRWIPFAYVWAEAPDHHGARYCRPSSNGSAAGNCLEEAILQGLYEAIERDAIAIWWYGRIRRPAARIPDSAQPWVERRIADYRVRGWSTHLLDLTHDLGVPVLVAVAHHPASDRLALGFGAHPDPALAVRRALAELAQVFDPEATRPSPWDGMAASQIEHLWPDPSAPRVAPRAQLFDHLRAQIEHAIALLRERELELIVVDKTRPDFGLCVAQVIVPGLRHPWPRLAPGRLYTVAHALGWIDRPLSAADLHPDPLLI